MSPRGEFEWIDRLAARLGRAALGPDGRPAIGDDAALVGTAGGETLAWTVDTLVEGVHFRFDWLEPADVGWRALAASLSDLAATGAEPIGALVTAAGPAAVFDARLDGLYDGLAALAEAAACPILGGDLSRAEGELHLTVTALGRVVAGPPLRRAGARPGDEVWVTGRLGGPAAAVALLAAAAPAGEARERLARPRPRLAEARWLRARAGLRAGIDVSDGVSGDAGHLAEAGAARIVLEPDRLPIHPGAAAAARTLDRDARAWALHGGEEFELLVVAGAGALEPLAEPFERAFGIPLTRIGRVEPGEPGLWEAGPDGSARPLEPRSWDHFRSAGG